MHLANTFIQSCLLIIIIFCIAFSSVRIKTKQFWQKTEDIATEIYYLYRKILITNLFLIQQMFCFLFIYIIINIILAVLSW